MKDIEIIVECATLDAWTNSQLEAQHSDEEPVQVGLQPTIKKRLPLNEWCHYLTSRDAIVPVIEKHCYTSNLQRKFIGEVKHCVYTDHPSITPASAPLITEFSLITATPRQLCIALLKATGKYHD